jgi:hypothetical protein
MSICAKKSSYWSIGVETRGKKSLIGGLVIVPAVA